MQIVWINSNILKKLFEETYDFLPLETGGVLLGYKDVLNNIVITDLIDAGPNAVHGESYFIPDGGYQQDELSRIYLQSKRITTYLGDWHSHPGQSAYMSWRDRKTLKKIAKTKDARAPNAVFLIIGTEPEEIKCWRFNSSFRKYIEPMEVKPF